MGTNVKSRIFCVTDYCVCYESIGFLMRNCITLSSLTARPHHHACFSWLFMDIADSKPTHVFPESRNISNGFAFIPCIGRIR